MILPNLIMDPSGTRGATLVKSCSELTIFQIISLYYKGLIGQQWAEVVAGQVNLLSHRGHITRSVTFLLFENEKINHYCLLYYHELTVSDSYVLTHVKHNKMFKNFLAYCMF